MKNPAAVLPGAWQTVAALAEITKTGEAATRLADSPDPVPDEIWDQAARHYDEQGMAALVLAVAVVNVFNRLNRVTRQPAGAR